MDTTGVNGPEGVTEAVPVPGESAEDRVNLEALAERIYRLLKEEARLERERLGGRRTW